MGNSNGNIHVYWKAFWDKSIPRLQGGFIWDMIDQGLRKTHPVRSKLLEMYLLVSLFCLNVFKTVLAFHRTEKNILDTVVTLEIQSMTNNFVSMECKNCIYIIRMMQQSAVFTLCVSWFLS
jgi:hypothetical protein